MKKWIETLEKLISDIEDHRNELQIEQDNSEEEIENFDPDEEGAIEPEEVNHEDEICKLDEVLGLLEDAKNLL